ncbi:hypothetical protein HMPREF9622_00756 [Cutibacterium modestum HL037PA3]|uniref:Uncharacterized protein n=1 Tax=Cutibacterium modestum HL044PA1 TaxID=765109 RepID=A0ABP2K532_9ACTN|nr:hypothetical protein HMPREF9621_01333 [Cutibacterium modestum HL037PA2]EFS91928.1 hypothetical protein HMPREF9607_01902 [Cutibacterium modestum HL044PA1]EFT16194.1 hypothetical protein HMPREF9622_00756 [Cutibacterium modestum HL037PA3]
MWIDRSSRQDDTVGTKSVSAADDRSGVSGITHLSADDGKAHILVGQLVARDLATHCEDSLAGDSVGERIDVFVGEHRNSNATVLGRLNMLGIAAWVRGRQQIDLAWPCQGFANCLRAFYQKQPGLIASAPR